MPGSTATIQRDIFDQLDDVLLRLSSLEQDASSPGFLEANATVVSSDGSTHVIMQIAPGVPFGITLTAGAFANNVYIDSTWSLGANDISVEIQLAKKVSGVYQLVDVKRSNGTSARWNALEPNTTYGFRIQGVSNSGNLSAWVPATGFTDVTTGHDSTVPAQAQNLIVSAGIRTLICRWDQNTEPDVVGAEGTYKVDVSTNNTFTAIVKTNYTAGQVTAFEDLTANTAYFVRVAAIDSSGNQGPYSTTASATTGVVTNGDIIAGTITGDRIFAASITAAQITVGTITGNLIAANTIDAHSITTSTLDVADVTINGGSIKIGSPPTTGIVLNSAGLRAYSGGSTTFILDSSTGNATFTGTINSSIINAGAITGAVIKTASSGKRITINDIANSIAWYTGGAHEAQPATVTNFESLGSGGFNTEFWNIQGGWMSNGAWSPSISFAGRYVNDAFSGASGYGSSITIATGGTGLNGTSLYLASGDTGSVTTTYPSFQVYFYDAGFTQHPLVSAFWNQFTLNSVLFQVILGTTASAATCYVDTSGFFYRSTSSLRFKTNIVNLEDHIGDELESVFDGFRPIKYVSNCDQDQGEIRYGFGAEDIADLIPHAAHYDEDGLPAAFDHQQVLAVVVAALQDARKRIKQLEART